MPHIDQLSRGALPTAREWNALADAYNAGSFGAKSPERGVAPGRVKAKNASGSDRERFEVMKLGDPSIALTTNGQVDLIFDLETATADGTPAVLVEPIADGQIGEVIIDGLALALVATASSTSDLFGTPNGTNHNIDAGSDATGIKLLTAPSTSAETLCPVLIGFGAAAVSTGLAVTPTGGISGMTGTGTAMDPFVFGSATCKTVEIDADDGEGEETTDDIELYNMVAADIEEDELVQWKLIGGLRFVDVEGCEGA